MKKLLVFLLSTCVALAACDVPRIPMIVQQFEADNFPTGVHNQIPAYTIQAAGYYRLTLNVDANDAFGNSIFANNVVVSCSSVIEDIVVFVNGQNAYVAQGGDILASNTFTFKAKQGAVITGEYNMFPRTCDITGWQYSAAYILEKL